MAKQATKKKTTKKRKEQPLDRIHWIDRNKLKANDYNPNSVAPPEMRLLKLSIMEDGWTQPIVVDADYTIVDGFHRWTVAGDKQVAEMTDGMVPVVILDEADQAQRKMATIRHNRARGTHGVLKMSDIVADLVEEGLSGDEIMKRLEMDKEEVVRLLARNGIPNENLFEGLEFSEAWTPGDRHPGN